jgi:hypothetical protein
MEWDELRSRFDRHFVNQVIDERLSEQQLIDTYQTELVKLYDSWITETRKTPCTVIPCDQQVSKER